MRLLTGDRLRELVIKGNVKGSGVEQRVRHTEIDICLGPKIWVEKFAPTDQRRHILNPNDWKSHLQEVDMPAGGFVLAPWRFILAETAEHFDMPLNVQGLMTLRSWAAKSGLEQSSSLTLKAGWSGHLILELFNSLAVHDLVLTEGLPIAQIQFFDISEDEDDGR